MYHREQANMENKEFSKTDVVKNKEKGETSSAGSCQWETEERRTILPCMSYDYLHLEIENPV